MLARQGGRVAVTDRSSTKLSETLAAVEKHSDGIAVEMDVRDSEQVSAAVKQIKETFGDVDILINNAGINRPASGLDLSEAEWDDHFSTNVKGGFFLAQRLAPAMIQKKWGRVIWISSQSGLVGIAGQPAYCSSKGAVIQLVRTLGLEWAKYGITVNSVAPTFVETDLTRHRLKDKKFLKFVLGKIPAGKLATVEDVSAAVAFLASEEARMVNCHTLSVDGGWTAW